MATRLLIIHQQLIFAVTIKQALEQTGLFDVHPFTTPDAAFDYLRDHPQDVALVDFTLPNVLGAKVIQELRSIQPDISVIVTPNDPDAGTLNIQGAIDTPFTARDLVPVIQQAIESSGEPLSVPPQPLHDEP
ncbi:MAG: response regulator, partial [Candidatus Methanoperedens sp.]|nr:response regulator [Candidatus Methanoperedens sp.]